MSRPQVCVGDINSHGAPVISTKCPNIIVGGRPSTTAGDIVAPHDSKPTHFAVTTTSQPRVLFNGTPVTRTGDFDTCGHIRVTGNVKVLT
tara:strand:+ start:237 stop:506 length:270 start_codon:yes stop_codon:yes gene_type:complete